MKPVIDRLLVFFLAPIKHYPVSFSFLAIALFLPNLTDPKADIPTMFFYWFLICVGLSYLLVALASLVSLLSRKAAMLLLIVLHVAIFAVVFTDIFLFKFFGNHINTYMLQLAGETNSQETSEFLETYTNTTLFKKTLLYLVLFAGAEIAFVMRKKLMSRIPLPASWKPGIQTVKAIISASVCLLVFLSLGFLIHIWPCYTQDWAFNYEEEKTGEYKLAKSFVFKTYQSLLQYYDERSSFSKSAKAQENITATLDGRPMNNIVIVIGESYSRHHSSLYGYDHETNPRLSSLCHLYVFDDVISPINGTSPAFKSFLSMTSVGDSLTWYDTPLFPAFFKKVGYNVTFFSNQFVKQVSMSAFDASAGFVNHPEIEPHIFSHRNNQKHKYDEGLIEEYRERRDEVENDSLNLVFFHLIGQHVRTNERFPEGRDHFHTGDYKRPEMTEDQIQDVADYDNATLYNDSVVYEIFRLFQDKDALIIYFADHGDEANDYRPHIGRTHNLNEMGVPALHCQLDIPFLIYLTDSCSALHPELEQRIAEARHRPFMTDDLPHLLLDLANISCPWFQPSRSPINDAYNAQRRRIIDGYSTSTPIDYDAACRTYGEWKIGY